jgi:uncharacterized protein
LNPCFRAIERRSARHVYSDIIFAAGLAIFALSDFPPTQRFGLVVLGGLIIDILANLFVLPLLGGVQWKKKSGKV